MIVRSRGTQGPSTRRRLGSGFGRDDKIAVKTDIWDAGQDGKVLGREFFFR
jgi:hypothetical protein